MLPGADVLRILFQADYSFVPQFGQKFGAPAAGASHPQVAHLTFCAGRFVPQVPQNAPLFSLPQLGHVQVPAAPAAETPALIAPGAWAADMPALIAPGVWAADMPALIAPGAWAADIPALIAPGV